MKLKKFIEAGMILVSIFSASFFLNYVWESFHAVFLYEGHNFSAKIYILMLIYVAAVDGSIISGIYLFISVLWKDMFWLYSMNNKQAFTAFMAGLVIAAIIEYRKVLVLKEWSYTQAMPSIFGIGVSPLLQLSITALMAFWLTRRIWFQRNP